MSILCAGITDIGKVRSTNQDSIYVNKEKRIFVVADGMGGHSGGDIASSLAVQIIPEHILKNNSNNPVEVLDTSIRDANTCIKKRADDDPVLKGMGTTVVTFYFKDDILHIANVGDSRGYIVSKNKLFQLTRDHSLIQEKINLDIYSREQAAFDPQKNIIIRTLGFEEQVETDIFTYKVIKNDIFLICSDGLHGKVSDKDILFIINKHLSDPSSATDDEVHNACQNLVNQANLNGGQDNISVILILAQ